MKLSGLIAAGVVSLALATPASAAAVFVGSWQVDQGPFWYGTPPNGPLAYTGQEAAAFLFGGSPSQYAISTVDNNPADINHMAWYSVIGLVGGHSFADSYSNKYLGQFYGPTEGFPDQDINAAASSYVWDNASGADFTNFAFRISDVPEPATWIMLILGFGAVGTMLRQTRRGGALAS